MLYWNWLVWGLFVVSWILEVIFNNIFTQLFFVVMWIAIAVIVVKFIWEVIKWHKKKKLNLALGK